MKRRAWLLAGAAVLIAVAVTGAAVVMSSADPGRPAEQQASTGSVERGKLSATVSLDGTLTYRARPDGSPYSAINQAHGTYTDLPDAGDRVDCGAVFYRVDDDPVLLLCGTVPAYRDLRGGYEGADVRQLNRNLRALGYDADPRDEDFAWKTAAALRRLQEDRGIDATGALDIGDVVVLPAAARVAKVTGQLGGPARPGAEVAQATSDTLVVQVALAPSRQGEVGEGDRVRVTLPGNESVTGKVRRLGRVAQVADEKEDKPADATIPVYVSLDKPSRANGLDAAPVKVDIMTDGVKSALSVPVTAIVGRPGGFGVEVVRDDGRRDLVAVELGLFDTTNGRVEVEGRLREGDRVVVPTP